MRNEPLFNIILKLVESKHPIDFGLFKIKAFPYMRFMNK
jgi:hypothetical protein